MIPADFNDILNEKWDQLDKDLRNNAIDAEDRKYLLQLFLEIVHLEILSFLDKQMRLEGTR